MATAAGPVIPTSARPAALLSASASAKRGQAKKLSISCAGGGGASQSAPRMRGPRQKHHCWSEARTEVYLVLVAGREVLQQPELRQHPRHRISIRWIPHARQQPRERPAGAGGYLWLRRRLRLRFWLPLWLWLPLYFWLWLRLRLPLRLPLRLRSWLTDLAGRSLLL